MFPLGNTFGSTPIYTIPYSDKPYKFFENVLTADLYPSHAYHPSIEKNHPQSATKDNNEEDSNKNNNNDNPKETTIEKPSSLLDPTSKLPLDLFPLPPDFQTKAPAPLTLNSFFIRWKQLDANLERGIVEKDSSAVSDQEQTLFEEKKRLYSNVCFLFFFNPFYSSILHFHSLVFFI